MSRLQLKMCARICNECPFSKSANPGWLGPHTVDNILHYQQAEALFPCHKQVKDDDGFLPYKIEMGLVHICRGYVASATKSLKRFGGNVHTGKDLAELQELISPDDLTKVLDRNEFRLHHTISENNQ